MNAIRNLWMIVIHPRRTSQAIAQDRSIFPSLAVVLVFGLIYALLFLMSHLAHDYPPPAGELKVWIDTWGEFAMLPFVKIPAENYRLAQAIFIIPLVLAIWLLMAGSARVLSVVWGGKVSFEQYLNVLGYSFFAFWIVGQVLDMSYSGILWPWILPALRMEYGPGIQAFCANFPSVMWTVSLSLGGLYNGIVTYELERFSLWKVVVIGLVTLAWPIVLISILLR